MLFEERDQYNSTYEMGVIKLTFLNERESLGEISLITGECQSTFMDSPSLVFLLLRHFRSEGTSLTNNPIPIDVDTETFEVLTRVGLSDVSCERTTGLVGLVIGVFEGKVKVIVALGVCSENWIILECGDVNGGSALPSSNQASTEELCTLVGSHPVETCSVLKEEGVKFGHELVEFPESEESAIFG
jgi:hypothetical protein